MKENWQATAQLLSIDAMNMFICCFFYVIKFIDGTRRQRAKDEASKKELLISNYLNRNKKWKTSQNLWIMWIYGCNTARDSSHSSLLLPRFTINRKLMNEWKFIDSIRFLRVPSTTFTSLLVWFTSFESIAFCYLFPTSALTVAWWCLHFMITNRRMCVRACARFHQRRVNQPAIQIMRIVRAVLNSIIAKTNKKYVKFIYFIFAFYSFFEFYFACVC